MKVFAQLSKVDVEKRLVFGIAAQEVADHSGEIMDYEKSKPNFMSWSDEMSKATDGLSLGNVRAMHGNTAAGKLTDIQYDDASKSISICAKIVDDNEWAKVLEGVYTGFSMGGKYGKRWDEGALKRYEAKPSEISLVDRPCIPTAKFFDIQKADGSMEKMAFKVSEVAPEVVATETATQKDVEYQVIGTEQDIASLGKMLNENSLTVADAVVALEKSLQHAVLHVDAVPVESVVELVKLNYTADDLEKFDGAAASHLIELEKVAARNDATPEEGTKKYGDVKFADAKNKKYPIDTAAHIRAAWSYINKEKNAAEYSAKDLATIKSAIVAAWKDKIEKDGPPSAVKKMAKGMYDVSRLSDVLQSIYYLALAAKSESTYEGDESDIPARLTDLAVLASAIFKDMATEEADELLAELVEPDEADEKMQMSQIACGLIKSGARNSKADAALVQSMHDVAIKLGAECSVVKIDSTAELAKSDVMVKSDDMQKAINDAVDAAISPLKKDLTDARDKIIRLEAQPLPARGVLRVISKGEDIAEQVEVVAAVVKKSDGSVDETASLIKGIHKSGGQPLIGFS